MNAEHANLSVSYIVEYKLVGEVTQTVTISSYEEYADFASYYGKELTVLSKTVKGVH